MPTYESGMRFARAHLLANDMVAVAVMVDEIAPVDGRRRLRIRSGDGGRDEGENRHKETRDRHRRSYHDRLLAWAR